MADVDAPDDGDGSSLDDALGAWRAAPSTPAAATTARRWKGRLRANGLVRSMSRKAKSPDNAGGGLLRDAQAEFFYEDWKGTTKGASCTRQYIVWYLTRRSGNSDEDNSGLGGAPQPRRSQKRPC
ncbi:MAG: hypothetical protein ACLT98_15715 [Eggerthellaceae bacterium]